MPLAYGRVHPGQASSLASAQRLRLRAEPDRPMISIGPGDSETSVRRVAVLQPRPLTRPPAPRKLCNTKGDFRLRNLEAVPALPARH